MGKIEWCVIVIAAWLISEAIFYIALGVPIKWGELPTIVVVCLIAYFTFPAPKQASDKEQG